MRKLATLGALLLFAACKGSETEPLVTTTVTVSASPAQISVNGTSQASAVPKDQNGNPIAGKTVAWTSLTPAIASVDATGLVRGLAAGTATIQATVDGVAGTTNIAVIAPVFTCTAGPTIVDVAVGEVRVLSSQASGGCAKVSAVGAVERGDYVIIAASLSGGIADVLSTFILKSDDGEIVPTNSVQTSSSILAQVLAPSASAEQLGSVQLSFERKLRRMERAQLDIRAAHAGYLARRLNRDLRYSVTSTIPAVGDKTTFKVPGQTSSCTNFTTITATVQYVSNRAIIYLDDAAPTDGFTATDYQQIADEFDTLIFPTDTSYFGTPLDDDNNGRVIILYTPEVNKLTPAGSSGFVGGFFFAGDLFPSTGQGGCAQSNMAELFYLLAPDPNHTINNNTRTVATVRQGTRGTIAHEFQHMINASERIRSPVLQDFEEVWLDEALAHFAEDAVGRAVRGIGEFENADFNRVRAPSFDDYAAFFFQNFARFQEWLKRPPGLAPISALADSSLGVRGAAWSLLHYTADQYAPGGNVKAWTKQLAAGLDGSTAIYGATNLTRHSGNVPIDSLLAGWLVANYADDTGIPVASKYTYRVYNMRSNQGPITQPVGTYPLSITTITGASFNSGGLQVRSGTGSYFQISRGGGSVARTFRLLNDDGATAASFPGASLIFLRTQ
jgi:hypothetical protein